MLISVCKPQTAIAGRMESRKRENQIWHNLEREPEIYNYENEWAEGHVAEKPSARRFSLFVLRYFLACSNPQPPLDNSEAQIQRR